MRLAISAAAVVVGLILATVIFGQPALYVAQVREQWGAFFGNHTLDIRSADRTDDPLATQVAHLQQQVMHLADALAASQSATAQAHDQIATLQQQLAASQSIADQSREQIAALPLAAPAERPAGPGAAPNVPEHRENPRPPSAPKPKSDPPVARGEPDDMQSVLARLRQRPYPAAQTDPVQPPDTRNSGEPPRPPLQARQRLEMARIALVGGRIDDARRLLQEVQVQLVFRPVVPGAEDAPAAAQGAADVARALGSLSGNDVSQTEQYIERAMDEVAGAAPQRLESAAGTSTGGYAPAYQSR